MTLPGVTAYVPVCVPYPQQVVQPGVLLQIMGWVTLLAPEPHVQPPWQPPDAPNFAMHAASAWVALKVLDAAQSSHCCPRPMLVGPLVCTVWQVAPGAPEDCAVPLTQHPVLWHSQPVVFEPLVLQFE